MGSKVVGVSASSSSTGKCSLFNTLCLKFYACLVALVGCCSGKKELWLGLNVPQSMILFLCKILPRWWSPN